MATKSISQLRQIFFRKWNASTSQWDVTTLDADDLGQDTIMTFNIAPRMKERATQMGTSSAPIQGTFDELSASITFKADDWYVIGKALSNWTAATFDGATQADGQIIGDSTNLCNNTEYFSVVAHGICDDGSTSDVEFTRCIPSLTDDFELGSSETPEVELALNPQIYNATIHSGDGYPTYTYRLGTYDIATEKHFDAATGTYVAASEGE